MIKTIIAIVISMMLWQPATVVEVNGDIVAVEFEDGNVFEFYGEGFDEGNDIEVLKLFDVIVDVR